MAARTIQSVARELCLAFPGVEEFESHGSPNYRARETTKKGAKKGRVFAVFALNHHGDGRVALWLNTPALEQSALIDSAPRQLYKPQYVGPSGWIGVELNKGLSWKRVASLVRQAYENSSPASLLTRIRETPQVAPPTVKMTASDIDIMQRPQALKATQTLRKICLALPETSEGKQFGTPVWRVGKRSFACLYDFGKGLTASFWVGIERQGPLEMDPRFEVPPYLGHNGWIALAVGRTLNEREIREYVLESYRHFATRRALTALDGVKARPPSVD